MSLGGIFNETCAGCGAVIGLTAAKLHHAWHTWEYELLRSLTAPDGYDPAALLNATAAYKRASEEYAAEQEKIRRKVEGCRARAAETAAGAGKAPRHPGESRSMPAAESRAIAAGYDGLNDPRLVPDDPRLEP